VALLIVGFRVDERKSEPPGGGGMELQMVSACEKVCLRNSERESSWGIESQSVGERELRAS
jgi:hypothetical protein